MVCLRGASATEQILGELSDQPVRVFVVWEPVLLTDWAAPSTSTLRRLSDSRVAQYWDKRRLISHSIAPRSRHVVWDYIAVYPAGALWDTQLPNPLYSGGPVVFVSRSARSALVEALQNTSHPLAK